ncbi:hypothetical protein DMUE_0815 [Dictyocoela muelleri]|nr:hypothetical protein DMUE_0815 [Dictyocoela muelleri]
MLSKSKIPKIMEIKTFINDTRYTTILDTGSSYNYVNEDVVKEHMLKTLQINKINAELVNGSIVSSEQEVILKLKFLCDTQEEYCVNANVMPNMDPDIILGIDFLTKNKVKIDLETMKFEISKTKYI